MSDCAKRDTRSFDNEKAKFPSWIQSKVFENLLKSLDDNFEEIVEFKVDNALAPGENFATLMLKVDIIVKLKDSSQKPVSFMLKVGHDTELFEEFMKFHDVFSVEAGMFSHFVPEFEKLYADVGVTVKFGAKSYELPTKENYILLENLKERGFKNVNRLNGLDRNHTECVLKKLAQWHAASALRVSRKGPFPREYCYGFIKPESYEIVKGMFDGSTKVLLESIKEFKGSEMYYDKVAKLQKQIADIIYNNAEPDLSEFNVLNHGDFWSNNIMFKYDEQGNVIETYFVDYQMPYYGTPVQDIIYFLLSSTQLEIKIKDFDYFIKFYHDHLVESLKTLNYDKKIPNLKEIHQMIYKYGFYGYMTATNVMAAVLCDPTDNATMDNFVNDSEEGLDFKKQMYTNDRFRSHMEVILPWLLNKGLLDY